MDSLQTREPSNAWPTGGFLADPAISHTVVPGVSLQPGEALAGKLHSEPSFKSASSKLEPATGVILTTDANLDTPGSSNSFSRFSTPASTEVARRTQASLELRTPS